MIPDSKNNAYFTDFRQGQIGRIDAKTGEISFFQTPTPHSAPRRGNMDAQDRLWFGEYRGDRIGMFDTRTREFKEWKLNTRWSAPYDVVLDKNEDAWTGSMVTDQVTRLNTRTGEMVDYLLPRSTNIRRVFVDSSTNPVGFCQPRCPILTQSGSKAEVWAPKLTSALARAADIARRDQSKADRHSPLAGAARRARFRARNAATTPPLRQCAICILSSALESEPEA